MTNTVLIRGDTGRISLEILGYENPMAKDISDLNWLRVKLDVVAGPFQGSVRVAVTTYELADFQQRLTGAVESVAGGVKFETLEGDLRVNIEFARTGVAGVQADVFAYDGGTRSSIHCEFETDPITLEATVQDLRRLAEQFPIQHSLRTPLE
ncbi:MAG: hypothetical protein V4587_18475 [Acidobacteriota bacterium]